MEQTAAGGPKAPEKPKPEEVRELDEDDFEVVGEEEGPQLKKNKSCTAEDIQIVNDLMGEFDVNILKEAELEIDELMKNMDLENERAEIPNSFAKIKIDSFPLFLTIKEFFYLMDSLMPESFFSRNLENIIKAGIKKNNGKRGFYRYKQNQSSNRLLEGIIFRETEDTKQQTQDFSSDEEDIPVQAPVSTQGQDAQPDTLLDINQPSDNLTTADLVTEVEYDDFREIFWPWFLESKKAKRTVFNSITPAMAWAQCRNLMTNDSSKGWDAETKRFEEEGDEATVKRIQTARYCHIGQEYRRWKETTGNYDLNDLYNHIYRYYENDVIANNLLDFLFLDEIQDIPVHLLSYMRRFGTKFFYFSGDNAQNITKGVTFKFKELATTYNSYKKSVLNTDFHPLSINFRSHQKILDLGNNLVFHLRMFFPDMIEFLPPEESKMDGPKPMVIPLGQKTEAFVDFLKRNMGVTGTGRDLTFKSGQVFITRDYKSKQKILEEYSNAIAFTILEAKGMEFDDVILFNYFSDSENHAPFLIFNQCLSVQKRQVEAFREPEFTAGRISYCKKDENSMDFTQYVIENSKDDFVRLTEKLLKTSIDEAADEIKLLYVAVTRARSRIVIYDEDQNIDPSKHKRGYFDSLWRKLDLINFSNSSLDVEEFNFFAKPDKIKEKKKWIKEGFEYMQRSLFDFAEICFSSGEFEKGVLLANLCRQAIQAKRDYYLLHTVTSSNPEELKELNRQKTDFSCKIEECAEKFEQLAVFNQAAQCYSMISQFGKAALIYEKMGDLSRAADYYIEMKDFRKAFELYKKNGDSMGMISTLQFENNPDSLLALVNIISKSLSPADAAKVSLIAKRSLRQVILALNSNLIDDTPVEQQEERHFDDLKEPQEGAEDLGPALERRISDDPLPPDESSFVEVKASVKEASARGIDDGEEDVKSHNSFEMMDLEEVMSNKNSFELIKSEIDELEKMSESFVEITVKDQVIKTNPSTAFEDLAIKHDEGFNFRENQILSKLIRVCVENKHLYSIDLALTDLDIEQVHELGVIEIPEKEARRIFDLVEETGAYTLRTLLERKLGYHHESISLLTSYLYSTSQIPCNVVSFALLPAVLQRSYFENRRLATISFLTNLHKFDVNQLKQAVGSRFAESRSGLAQIILLGYFRQMVNLLSQDLSNPILELFGEVQTLFMVKSANSEQIFDREALINQLILGSGLQKLYLMCTHFARDPKMLNCAYFYFCANYLMNPKTYTDQGAEEVIQKFAAVNSSLHTLFEIYYDAQRATTASSKSRVLARIKELQITKLSKRNRIEDGMLIGALFQLVMLDSRVYGSSFYELKEFKEAQVKLNQIRSFLSAKTCFYRRYDKFMKGLLMTFQVNLISPFFKPLIVFSYHGALVARTSPVLVNTGKLRPQTSNLLVAEAGHDYFVVPLDTVFDSIKVQMSQFVAVYWPHIFTPSADFITAYFQKTKTFFEVDSQIRKLKLELEVVKQDEFVRDSVLKRKKKEIADLVAGLVRPTSFEDDVFESLMVCDWNSPKTYQVTYNFNAFYNFFRKRRQTFNLCTPKADRFRTMFFMFNMCITNDVLHLFLPYLERYIQSSFRLT